MSNCYRSGIAALVISGILASNAAAACEIETSPPDGTTDDRERQALGCGEVLPGASAFGPTGCPEALDPYADLAFEDSLHQGWYQRFWYGDCDGLSGSAWSECGLVKIFNPEYWFDTVDQVVQRAAPSERPALRVALWRLGRVIGHEWARANDIRRIDTDDIEEWGDELRRASASDLCATVQTLFSSATTRLQER